MRMSCWLLWCLLIVSALATSRAAATQPAPKGGVAVLYRGEEILRIHRGLGNVGPAERATEVGTAASTGE